MAGKKQPTATLAAFNLAQASQPCLSQFFESTPQTRPLKNRRRRGMWPGSVFAQPWSPNF